MRDAPVLGRARDANARQTYLLAVLVRYDGSLRRTSVRAEDDTVLEETSDDCGTGAGGFGEGDAAFGEECVPGRAYIR